MTIDEAIEILENTHFFGRSDIEIDTAIMLAVRALKQQEKAKQVLSKFLLRDCEMCEKEIISRTMEKIKSENDCISRKQAIECVKEIFKSNSEMKMFSVLKMLDELPVVNHKE